MIECFFISWAAKSLVRNPRRTNSTAFSPRHSLLGKPVFSLGGTPSQQTGSWGAWVPWWSCRIEKRLAPLVHDSIWMFDPATTHCMRSESALCLCAVPYSPDGRQYMRSLWNCGLFGLYCWSTCSLTRGIGPNTIRRSLARSQ